MGRKVTINIEGQQVDFTDKEILFVDYYLSDAKRNGTEAAIRAGYSENSARQQASENLSKPNILKLIAHKTKPTIEVLQISREKVVRHFAAIAFSRASDFLTNDYSLKNLDEIEESMIGAIKHVEKTEKGFKITFYDKISALSKLMDLLGEDKGMDVQKASFFESINSYIQNFTPGKTSLNP